MELRNLTPHALSLLAQDGSAVALPPSGVVARRAVLRRTAEEVAGLPVAVEALGPVEGLPAPEDGVIYVISRLVAEAVPHRTDVLAPGEPVRDDGGRIIGARGLCRVLPATASYLVPEGCALPEVGAVQTLHGATYRVTQASAVPDMGAGEVVLTLL